MPKAPTNAELVATIASHAGFGRANIRAIAREAYKDAGFTTAEANAAVDDRFPAIVRALDSHMKSLHGQRKQEYYMQDGTAHVVHIPDIGPLRFTAALQEAMIRMHWQEFEILCSNLMKEEEADEIRYTRGSKDGGFDFVGKRPVDRQNVGEIGYLGPTILDGLPLFLAGQAKCYALSNPIDGDLAATMDGKLARFANGTGTQYERALGLAFQALGWNGGQLTVRIVATCGTFTTGALQAAVDDSTQLLDGEHLAQQIIRIHEGDDSFSSLLETMAALSAAPVEGVLELQPVPGAEPTDQGG